MKNVPVVLGIDWYTGFDRPTLRDGKWWIPEPGKWGSLRGGHAICGKPKNIPDNEDWWKFYDQGSEGACVGFAWTRAKTLLERAKFKAPALYYEAQRVDEWPGGAYPGANPVYEGTSVRAGAEVLRTKGHITVNSVKWNPAFGIKAYRWTTDPAEVCRVLGWPVGPVPLLNSWGEFGYPHVTWMPFETLGKLLEQGGEAAVPTDR